MINLTACDYCAQRNYDDALCCQWCGAPLPLDMGRLASMDELHENYCTTSAINPKIWSNHLALTEATRQEYINQVYNQAYNYTENHAKEQAEG